MRPFVRLEEVSPGEAYRLLADAVVPRPIALVSTLSPVGVANLAPFSFFGVGGSNPPSLVFSPTLNGRGEEKDTLRNIRATGEYVIHLVDRSIVGGMNATSAAYHPHESEWPDSGFTPIAAQSVAPPIIAEAGAAFECRLVTIVEHGEGPAAARYVIGEVLVMHGGPVAALARLGGSAYMDMADTPTFELDRPVR
ncbi:flavin reductase family protein [bacterium]|nr:MAG: flavin reductase family protein [bacterium]